MNTLVKVSLAAFAMTAASSVTASADSTRCHHTISGFGRSSHVDGSTDWSRFGGNVPEGLARNRAILSWKSKVSKSCPGHTTLWWRAHEKRVECDGSAGHTDCTVFATPGRKWFAWLSS